MGSHARELSVALAAARDAAALCQAVRVEELSAVSKSDLSPVTIADYASQVVICRTLARYFPQDPVVAEEESTLLSHPAHATLLRQVYDTVSSTGEPCSTDDVCRWLDHGSGSPVRRFWTVDPLDGTKGFLRRGQYAIAIALIEDGRPVVAALACPALAWDLEEPQHGTGVYFAAVHGGGAWTALLDRDDLAVVQVEPSLNPSDWLLTESVEPGHGHPDLQAAVARQVGITAPAVLMDSQAKYGLVARGDVALYLRFPSPSSPSYRENLWDHAAGALVVQEAGGQVSDMFGKQVDWGCGRTLANSRGLVIGSKPAHRRAIEAVARLLN